MDSKERKELVQKILLIFTEVAAWMTLTIGFVKTIIHLILFNASLYIPLNEGESLTPVGVAIHQATGFAADVPVRFYSQLVKYDIIWLSVSVGLVVFMVITRTIKKDK